MLGIVQTPKITRRTIRQDITGLRTSILQDAFLVRREEQGPVMPGGELPGLPPERAGFIV